MKSPILLTLLFILASTLTSCVTLPGKSSQQKAGPKLGQTEAQITKALGASTAHYMNGFYLFHDDKGNEVQAHFSGGKADSLFYYTFKRNIAEPWLSSVLILNSKGAPWILEASSNRRQVYRSTDGKYHAFVSNGNQLMIDTDAFFQKAIHQKVKTIIPVDDLPTCIFAPDHLEAKIGMTESSIIKEYGQSVDAGPDGAKEYSNGYQDIMVHYKNGRCDAVLYTADKGTLISDCWVSCLLEMNSQGNAWIVSESSKPNRMIYWTPSHQGTALTALMLSRSGLFVYTKQYYDNRSDVLGKKVTSESYFQASITPCAPVWLNQTEVVMTKKLGTPKRDKNVRVYHTGDLTVQATFDHGVCNKIIYISDRGRKFTDHWVSATLAVNSGWRSWFVHQNHKPKRTYYSTFDHRFYARLKDRNNLGVMTEAVFKKSGQKPN